MGLQGSRFADRKTTPRLSGREKERPRVERRILSPVRNEVVLVGFCTCAKSDKHGEVPRVQFSVRF